MLFATRVLMQHRQPMIRFMGRRHPIPAAVDHSPQPHPASPSHSLPDSFVSYRQRAVQHGPIGGRSPLSSRASASSASSSSSSSSAWSSSIGPGERSGHSLGSVEPPQGEYFDRGDLPQRFHRMSWTQNEIEAIDTGGASLY